jgi:uncharacterized membrane protein HdeD (DUF308 family)
MLTRPAAAFMQLLGTLFALAGIVALATDTTTGALLLLVGVAMLFYGGREARARMRRND